MARASAAACWRAARALPDAGPAPSPSDPACRLPTATDTTACPPCFAVADARPEPPEPVEEPPDPPLGRPPEDGELDLASEVDPLLVEIFVTEVGDGFEGAVSVRLPTGPVEVLVGVATGEVTELTTFSTVFVTVGTGVGETVEVEGSETSTLAVPTLTLAVPVPVSTDPSDPTGAESDGRSEPNA